MQRAILLSGRLANLKSACIQHGIFQSKSPGHIMDGWFADHFLVINDHQREMLIAKGMAPGKIRVMGFHSPPYRPKRTTAAAGQRKICFLGQPWSRYGSSRASRYAEIVGKTAMTLHVAGIDMAYKPHPWERGSDYLNRMRNVVDITLNDALENYDVFISLTSTALIETQAAGRIAIQIMDDEFDADDLSVHGNIITINANDNEHWTEKLLLSLDATASTVSRSESSPTRFIDALEGRR